MNARCLTVACVLALLAGSMYAAESKAPPEPRSLTAIRTDVSEALKSEATSRRAGDNAAEVLRLVDLYLEIASHPKRDTSPLLNDLGQQVRLRLVAVRERIERQMANKKPSAKKNVIPATVGARPADRVLAQQAAPPGVAPGAANAAGQDAAVAAAPNVTARPTDLGPELVELIEATVSPATWRINGGNGAVVYFSPLHVIVVSAPDEVHAQIGGVLKQLQAAQRRQDGSHVVTDVVAERVGQ